jgi:hypothetical protein
MDFKGDWHFSDQDVNNRVVSVTCYDVFSNSKEERASALVKHYYDKVSQFKNVKHLQLTLKQLDYGNLDLMEFKHLESMEVQIEGSGSMFKP